MDSNEKLANKIVNLRESRNWTQKELADKLHFDKVKMNKIEHNNRTVTPEELKQIADIFDVSIDYMLDNKSGDKKDDLSENQKLVAYSIDPDVTDEEREAIINMVKEAMKFKRRI